MVSSYRVAISSVALNDARQALSELAPRLRSLLRSVRDPHANAIGSWTVGEVAAHLSHVADVDLVSALGVSSDVLGSMGFPEVNEVADVAKLNATALERDGERDPAVLAERIEELAGYLIERAEGDDKSCDWLFGARIPLSAVCSHYVSEMAVHGRDIARAARLPWKIDPAHARIAIEGFYLPIMSAIPLGPTGPDVVESSCEVRARGGSPWVIVQTRSGLSVEMPGRRVDLHMSGDPVAMLLVMSGRMGQLRPALIGQIFAWGRHPLRAMRMLNDIRRP